MPVHDPKYTAASWALLDKITPYIMLLCASPKPTPPAGNGDMVRIAGRRQSDVPTALDRSLSCVVEVPTVARIILLSIR